MLRNPFYIGKVKYKGEILPGSQPPLLDQSLFDAVQAKLSAQWTHRTTTRLSTEALLSGLLFDDAGQKIVVTHATKNRVRYRYYVSMSCLRSPTDQPVGSVRRVQAKAIELAVSRAIFAHIANGSKTDPSGFTRVDLVRLVAKIEVREDQLAISFKPVAAKGHASSNLDEDDHETSSSEPPKVLLVTWKKASIAREIIRPATDPARREKPIKANTRVALIRSIGLGRYWLQKILNGETTVAAIAAEHGCGVRIVNLTISLSFLSPTIVAAAVEGRLPRGLSVRTLKDPMPEWSLQMSKFGLTPTACQ